MFRLTRVLTLLRSKVLQQQQNAKYAGIPKSAKDTWGAHFKSYKSIVYLECPLTAGEMGQ